MRKAIIHVHGKGGDATEADHYKQFCKGYDIYGVDYSDHLPWVVRGQIEAEYDELAKQYDEISLITNSIGTYFAMLALQDRKVKKAFCISPILNMERLVTDMMSRSGVSEAELEERKEISTGLGETLSWEYLSYVRRNPINWTAPTAILFGGKDKLTSRATVDEFVSSHNASLTVMENGEHWFHTDEQLGFLGRWMRLELRQVEPKETTRATAFDLWMKAPNPMVTFFKSFDVMPLVQMSKAKGLKFNMLLDYCIGKAATAVKEFHVLPIGDKLYKFERIAVNTIVANKDGEVNSCDIAQTDDLALFNADYLRLTKEVHDSCADHDLSEDYMVIGTSAIVDTEIDGAVGMNSGIFNNPFMIWGRYRIDGDKALLPISFQFHHTQMDGAHAGRFLKNLQDEIDSIKDRY